MTKVEQHGSTPSDLKPAVNRHASAIRSDSDAGGEVDRSKYTTPSPRPER